MGIIIGLIGGRPADREEIANQLEQRGRRQIVAFRANPHSRAGARVRDLNIALERAGAGGNVLAVHVEHAAEAETIRRRGGVIWHVDGLPSETVPIQQGDLPVTRFQGGRRHYLDPFEALTETLLGASAAY